MREITKIVINCGGVEPKVAGGFIHNGKKLGLEQFREERERLYKKWQSGWKLVLDFKDWLKTYKEDDMWMPEVGEECEVIGKPGDDNYYKCKIVGRDVVDGFDCAVFKILNYSGEKNYYSVASAGKFLPIQSEEEKLVQRAKSVCFAPNSEPTENTIKSLIAANWRPIKPSTPDDLEQDFMEYGITLKPRQIRYLHRAGCRFLDGGE